MDILHKIEEIRQQPEHIRLRWVWGLTATFMLGVLLLWAILLKSQTANFSEGLHPEDSNFSAEFDQQKKSIKDVVGQLNNATNSPSSAAAPASGNSPANAGEGFNVNSDPNADVNQTANPSSN